MKDLIIISWYDSGCNFSISIDGEVKEKYEIEFKIKEKNNPYKEIVSFCKRGLGAVIDGKKAMKRLTKRISDKYKKSVILCEDGSICIGEE